MYKPPRTLPKPTFIGPDPKPANMAPKRRLAKSAINENPSSMLFLSPNAVIFNMKPNSLLREFAERSKGPWRPNVGTSSVFLSGFEFFRVNDSNACRQTTNHKQNAEKNRHETRLLTRVHF